MEERTFYYSVTYEEYPRSVPITFGSKNTPEGYRPGDVVELPIRGQDFYSGFLKQATAGYILHSIKKAFKGKAFYIPYIPINQYPLSIEMYIYDTIDNSTTISSEETNNAWDVNNRGILYSKAFVDLLKNLDHRGKPIMNRAPVIPDDNRLFITHDPAGGYFVPIEDTNQRKLVFIIKSDTRKEIIENQHFTPDYLTKIVKENHKHYPI